MKLYLQITETKNMVIRMSLHFQAFGFMKKSVFTQMHTSNIIPSITYSFLTI